MALWRAAALASCLAAGFLASARAHEAGGLEPRIRLDPLPKALAGVVVEVHDTLAPQLVVENKTQRTLEVLDEQGVPFLRIGRSGVEGNINAAALFQRGMPIASGEAHPNAGPPTWRSLSSLPSWGWFDPRLRGIKPWRLPVRIGSDEVAITGTNELVPRSGSWRATLVSAHDPAPGVHVALLPGRVPGMLLENSGSETVLVLGASDEPFLRITAQGADANLKSPTWRQNALARGETLPISSDHHSSPEWLQVSRAPRFAWIEFRAWPGTDEPSPEARGRSGVPPRWAWSIPVRIGERRVSLVGLTTWQPVRAARSASGPE
jgi:hypothetical protein